MKNNNQIRLTITQDFIKTVEILNENRITVKYRTQG